MEVRFKQHEGGYCQKCGAHEDVLYTTALSDGVQTQTMVLCQNCARQIKARVDEQNGASARPAPTRQQTRAQQSHPKARSAGRQKLTRKQKAVFVVVSVILALTVAASAVFAILQAQYLAKGLVYTSDSPYEDMTFGRYEQDGSEANGAEPIEWIVMDEQDGKKLLLSKYALDCRPYGAADQGDGEYQWENCALRAWLNGTFLTQAFTESEQASIQNSRVPAEGGAYAESFTQDKVFLLSVEETLGRYMIETPSGSIKNCVATKYAQKRCVEENYRKEKLWKFGWWWLRDNEDSYVHDGQVLKKLSGVVTPEEVVPDTRYLLNAGYVRPAIWVYTDGTVPESYPTDAADIADPASEDEYAVPDVSDLSDEEIRLVNTFLSNFSEIGFANIERNDTEAVIDFAVMHDLVNYSDATDLSQTERFTGYNRAVNETVTYTVSLPAQIVAQKTQRFFGVSPSDRTTDRFYYGNGQYYSTGRMRGTHPYFTNVYTYTDAGDGTVEFQFKVFESRNTRSNGFPVEDAYKGLANTKENNSAYIYCYSGTARLEKVAVNGGAPYQVISIRSDRSNQIAEIETVVSGDSDLPQALLPYADGLRAENRRYQIRLKEDDWNINCRSTPEVQEGTQTNIIGKLQSGTTVFVEYIYNDTWVVCSDNGTYYFMSIYASNDQGQNRLIVPVD